MAGRAKPGSNWGGKRAGAGPKPRSASGHSITRVRFECSPDYRAWVGDFAAAAGLSELVLFRTAMARLAEAHGFRPSPPN
jgi:hypothetical protein